MPKTPSHPTPPALCPACGYAFDHAAGIQGKAKPGPGDWSVCIRCGEPMVFDANLVARAPGFGVYEALRFEDPRVFGMLEQARALCQQRQRMNPIPDRGGRA